MQHFCYGNTQTISVAIPAGPAIHIVFDAPLSKKEWKGAARVGVVFANRRQIGGAFSFFEISPLPGGRVEFD